MKIKCDNVFRVPDTQEVLDKYIVTIIFVGKHPPALCSSNPGSAKM